MSLWRLSTSLRSVRSIRPDVERSIVRIAASPVIKTRTFCNAARLQDDEVESTNTLKLFKDSFFGLNDESARLLPKVRTSIGQASIKNLLHEDSVEQRTITLNGYLGNIRTPSKNLAFAEFYGPELKESIQLVSVAKKIGLDVHESLRHSKSLTPVRIQGQIRRKASPQHGEQDTIPNEIELSSLQVLDRPPSNIDNSTIFGPDQRHLQLKTNAELRQNLKFRSKVNARIVKFFNDRDFDQIETPLLFKSTSEGAREFLVPSRRAGLAYALPQSPQQYKQILMASAIPRYFQIARCFRDEDMRADRQPEFTQIDLECAFEEGEGIMQIVESLVKDVMMNTQHALIRNQSRAADSSEMSQNDQTNSTAPENWETPFRRITYNEAMSKYGSDKPDLRLDYNITRIDHLLPVDLVSKISSLNQPRVDITVFRANHEMNAMREFYHKFLDSPVAFPYHENPDGGPGIFIYDSTKPLSGLQAFGFEAAEEIERLFEPSEGDLIILQARQDKDFTGGSTALGRFMLDLNKAAVADGLKRLPTTLEFLWVTDFPLFTSTSEGEPGQSGTANLQSTHHPFTSPKTQPDVDLLITDPLKAIADHYDLVLNGVEIGGGSKRIHNAEAQRFVMEKVLRMPADKVAEFDHLLKALGSGCPPHAGFALGFDRFVAMLLGKESVRDVIAFPKWGKGDDPMVNAPSKVSAEGWKVYNIKPDA